MFGIARGDKLVLCANGDVVDFDPAVIEAALKQLKQPSYYERYCLPKGGCKNCTLIACPVTN